MTNEGGASLLSPAAQRSVDIYNIIRQNCSPATRALLPQALSDPGAARTTFQEVGAWLRGNVAISNEFVNQLNNAIFLNRFRTLAGGNKYEFLKKGNSPAGGDTVRLTFTNITKAVEFNPELAASRFFYNAQPDVRSVLLHKNYAFMWRISINNSQLKQAFESLEGLSQLTNDIINAPARGQKYNELNMARYLICRGIIDSRLKQVPLDVTSSENPDNATLGKSIARAVRAMARKFTIPDDKWNQEGVVIDSPPEANILVIEPDVEAFIDVEVLAFAFNKEDADVQGRIIVDNFKDFRIDNFDGVATEVLSDMGVVDFTTAEKTILNQVKAVFFEEEWAQIYDILYEFRQQELGVSLSWQYWLHVWQIWGTLPWANGVAFFYTPTRELPPTTITVTLESEGSNTNSETFNYSFQVDGGSFADWNIHMVQSDAFSTTGVAIYRPGSIVVPTAEGLSAEGVPATNPPAVPTSVILAASNGDGTWSAYRVTLPTTVGGSATATMLNTLPASYTYDQVWALSPTA